jgi:hypothetical protein
MKKILLATLVLPFFLVGTGSAANQMMNDGKRAMMSQNMQQQDGSGYGQNTASSKSHPSMAGSYGMMPGMMGGYGMGGGMMGGYGMRGGMMGGFGMGQMGMMGPMDMGQGVSPEEMTKFFEETKELRKELHDLRFQYGEKMRDPDTTVGELQNMREEMYELHNTIMEKAQQQ